MRIIEIKQLHNGAHRNQNGEFSTIPDGWAIIPDDMPIPDTFPFVNIEVEEVTHYYDEEKQEPYTVMVVTSMTAGVVPEPAPEPEPQPTQLDIIEAQVTYTAMMTDTLLGG